ncbi:predicted protein [Sclerotinia sclerotiorum 1980 UF-70]|uniref:Uncharacterized protein n=2 Tax=Sclerotinia sclerotiorum (strain ATCC 18683 / 1980 / Ss-1) TaxID=665079 RepID=A7EWR9_SCLS1|nr:predicted protein [Sclerotinia sclerotiorum 1980 UF-70]APA05365.1 hypothetical protein sscle_01g001350 [Sclerotinia sclerotiorum 1980 UF-70]EDN93911.1 predicted protein [Sclerotinia sclerotiorum 1980 UF-70]
MEERSTKASISSFAWEHPEEFERIRYDAVSLSVTTSTINSIYHAFALAIS